jgi:hypothetical protein
MNMARVSAVLLISFSWALAAQVVAQELPGRAVVDTEPQEYDRFNPFDGRNIQFKGDFGDGLGYVKGYQTFGVFQPIVVEPDELLFFVNPRGIITYSGQLAGNVGAGLRYYNPQLNRIFGGGFWWDHDDSGFTQYDQLGISLESLGNILDFRVNGYLPTNDDERFVSQYYNGSVFFVNQNIGLGRNLVTQTPLKGFDFEAGGALPGIGDLGIRTYAGGYYYQGEGRGAAYGVRGRAELLITQDVWAQVAVTHDELFGTNVTASAIWYWGNPDSPRFFHRQPVHQRLYNEMVRNYRVAVHEQVLQEVVLALRAGGVGGSGGAVGTPIVVTHVNNSAAAGGDGSIERPLSSLPTTTGSNVDIVFVHRGDGTSRNMSNGITLNDFQRLLGDGYPHQVASLQGTFLLPGVTAGAFPTITNSNFGGSAVTLANNNEVAAFNIVNPRLHGITGTGINNFNLHHLNITGANLGGPVGSGSGINLTNVTGVGTIVDSSFNGNNAQGIRVANTGGNLGLTIARVNGNGNRNSILASQTGGSMALSIIESTTSLNSGDGIVINVAGGATFNGDVNGITSNSNGGNGLNMTVDGAGTNAAIGVMNSTINGNTLNGTLFTTTNNAVLNAWLLNNTSTISNNLGAGVVFNANTQSQVNAILSRNVIANNGSFGVQATGTDANLNLVMGTFSEDTNFNGALDVGEDVNGNGIIDGDGNLLIANRGAGVAFTLQDTAFGTFSAFGNTIVSTQDDSIAGTTPTNPYGGQAIDIRLTGSNPVLPPATANLIGADINHNTLGSLTDLTLGNVGGGIVILADQRTRLTNVNIGNADPISGNGNKIGRNQLDGINIQRNNEAVVDNILIGDNEIRFNTGDGIDITARNSGPITGFDTNDYVIRMNTITNNNGNAIRTRVEADANARVDIFDNNLSLNGGSGIQTTELASSASDDRHTSGTWQRNFIFGNATYGIDLQGAHNVTIGSLTTPANGNNILANAGTGIRITGATGALVDEIGYNTIALNGSNTAISNSAGGVDLQAITVNQLVLAFNTIANNTGDGFQILSPGTLAGFIPVVGPFGPSVLVGVNVTATGNYIHNNTGRGVDILNRGNPAGSGRAIVQLFSNIISGNGQEGVYAINTASATQGQTALANVALLANGAVTNNPRMFLNLDGNRIEGNGNLIGGGAGSIGATGFVLRVGTSGGGFGPFTDGFFFGEGASGVGAFVTNNSFSGNQGDDVYFDSFTSTVTPGTGTTWNATTFNTTGYQSDPLARLDLTFVNNTFDAVDVNNTGAFYNNAETAFKSRDTAATDPGPFAAGGTRERNAQRLAARFGLPPATPGGASTFYLYPGLRQSTFRLLNMTLADVVAGGFITDNFYTGIGDANGIFTPGGFTFGKLPYGWNFLGGDPRPQ